MPQPQKTWPQIGNPIFYLSFNICTWSKEEFVSQGHLQKDFILDFLIPAYLENYMQFTPKNGL